MRPPPIGSNISAGRKARREEDLAMDLRRIVLLGDSGFVGSHLVAHLRRHRPNLEIVAGSC
jgi:hypothetical protein